MRVVAAWFDFFDKHLDANVVLADAAEAVFLCAALVTITVKAFECILVSSTIFANKIKVSF